MVKKSVKKSAKRSAKSSAEKPLKAEREIAEIATTINDPLGCCQYIDGSGQMVQDENVRQSECLKIPGSIFDSSRNGKC